MSDRPDVQYQVGSEAVRRWLLTTTLIVSLMATAMMKAQVLYGTLTGTVALHERCLTISLRLGRLPLVSGSIFNHPSTTTDSTSRTSQEIRNMINAVLLWAMNCPAHMLENTILFHNASCENSNTKMAIGSSETTMAEE
jgi:hypothetical protein